MTLASLVPILEVIEEFSNLFKTKVMIYYNHSKPLIFGSRYSGSVCALKCLNGVHFNFVKSN